MQSRWNDGDAKRMIERYAPHAEGTDLALRVYTSRLLGQDPQLVLHGGGNTSVKTVVRDILGENVDVICVKGSGWDMAQIEPAGLPAVRIAPLRKLRHLSALSDEDMVAIQRVNLLDPQAPTPSVETLLHAFLPHKFVDHTHSASVLSLANQPDAAEICKQVYGRRAAIVPYVMPGFALAKKAAEIYEADPHVEGMILLNHGIFSFGESANQAYLRMIELVTLAEERLQKNRRKVFAPRSLPGSGATLAQVAPILRGACAIPSGKNDGSFRRFVLEFRTSAAIRNFVDGQEVDRYSQQGVPTPDHTIRTKNWPLILPPAPADKLDDYRREVHAAVERFAANYREYFARNDARQHVRKRALDPMPRVVLAPGLGIFGLGASTKEARVAADLAESAIQTTTDAEAIGQYRPLSEADLFDMEYWSLEQAKLGKGVEKPLVGQVAVITGGGGTIGAATAKLFAANGAEVAVLDLNESTAKDVAKQISPAVLGLQCDVTDSASVQRAFQSVVERFGGVDILVSNAGAAWTGPIGEVDEALLRKSFELNFFSHQKVAQAALRIMRTQGTGGALLFNVSKQAVNPGPDFGPYGLPKAATLFLVRQYALEYGKEGIRANAVNADRIRSGILTNEMIASRSSARGLSEQEYLSGNLLHREVTAEDVAQAFLHHAVALKTTADVTTVDGGNIAAALR